ncbi:MAG: glycosyltransferase [Planctomycetota bacterium]|nr:glycosyltransferase [Planctomycetota bacterium]
MRILHIVQSLDPSWGGIARALADLATELCAQGESCRIATLAGGRFGSAPDIDGVEVLRFESSDSQLGRSPDFNRRIPELAADADVVHLHGLWTGQNWSAGKAARRGGTPYIMTPHSHMMPWAWRRSAWKKRPAGWLFEHHNLRRAACLHALADGEAEHIRKLRFNDRIAVVPNGIHGAAYSSLPSPDGLIERFPELKDRRWLLFLGRIAEQKGIVPAMQACFDMAASGDDWQFVVAGPDEFGMKRMLQAAIARKGLSDRVTFTGMLSRDDVRACLGHASVLLQPSLSEGLSVSVLEALASQTPVILSPGCNMPEVGEADAGRIVEPTRSAIASALRVMLNDPADNLRAMGERGRALIADRFDWSVVIPKYREMYAKVIAGKSP